MWYESGEGESKDRGEISATAGHHEGAPVRDQRRQPQPPAGTNLKGVGVIYCLHKKVTYRCKNFLLKNVNEIRVLVKKNILLLLLKMPMFHLHTYK